VGVGEGIDTEDREVPAVAEFRVIRELVTEITVVPTKIIGAARRGGLAEPVDEEVEVACVGGHDGVGGVVEATRRRVPDDLGVKDPDGV
jgi:hypothetical protein